MRISRRGMPAASSVSRIGGKSVWFGTGRVTSLTTTQALRRPRGQFPQRPRLDRPGQTVLHRGVGLGQGLGRPILKARHDVSIGQFNVQARSPIFQMNLHDPHPVSRVRRRFFAAKASRIDRAPCMRLRLIVTRSVSEARKSFPRLRFGLRCPAGNCALFSRVQYKQPRLAQQALQLPDKSSPPARSGSEGRAARRPSPAFQACSTRISRVPTATRLRMIAQGCCAAATLGGGKAK